MSHSHSVTPLSSPSSRDLSINRIERIAYTSDLLPSLNQEYALVGGEWNLRRSNRPSIPFHSVEALEFFGPLDTPKLEESLNRVVERQAGLRSSFIPNPSIAAKQRAELFASLSPMRLPSGLYLQAIVSNSQVPLPLLDFSSINASSEQEIARLMKRESSKPFALNRFPLFRVVLARFSPNYHVLTMITHHLISDMWALRILRRDLMAIYCSLTSGQETGLPELTVHAPDIAAWERNYLPSCPALRYWQKQWPASAEGRLAWADFPGAAQTGRPAIPAYEEVVLDARTSQHLRAGARAFRVTLPGLLLTAFGLMLRCLTRRTQISVWTNFANRSHPQTQAVVALLANTHPMLLDLQGIRTCTEVVRGVSKVLRDGIAHQEVPSGLVWASLAEPPEISHERILFDYIDEEPEVMVPSPVQIRRVPQTTLRRMRQPAGLEVLAINRSEEIVLMCGYSYNRFTGTTVREMLTLMGRIAVELVSHHDRRLSDLGLA